MQNITLSGLKYLIESGPPAIILRSRDFVVVHVNDEFQEVLSLVSGKIIGKVFLSSAWPDFFDQRKKKVENPALVAENFFDRKRRKKLFLWSVEKAENSHASWFCVDGIPVIVDDSENCILIFFKDITEAVTSINQVRYSVETFEKIFNETPMGICITDENGYFESLNDAYLSFYGYSREEMLGQHFTMVVPEESRDFFAKLHDDFIGGAAEVRGNWDVVDRYGNVKAILADAARITGEDGRPKKVTFIMDISRERQYERMLAEMAVRDPLTKLFNRRYFFEQMRREIGRYKRHGSPLSVCLFDIDYFKHVNDQYGHVQGDDVLKNLAELMLKEFRDTDILCRYGGEEFLVLMPDTPIGDARVAAERFREKVESSDFLGGLSITVSGGVKGYDDGIGVRIFIEQADSLLYASKQKGRNLISG